MAKKIAVLAAMDMELKPIIKTLALGSRRAARLGGLLTVEGVFKGNEILLCRTGMGRKNAKRAVELLLNWHDIGLVVIAGVAGGVGRWVDVGDVAVPMGVSPVEGGGKYFADNAVVAGIRDLQSDDTPLVVGGTAYTAQKIFGVEEKKALAERDPEAVCVDMEAFWIVKSLAEANVPFVMMKAVSDRWNYEFPDIFLSFFGRIDYPAIIMHFIKRPGDLAEVLELWKNVRLAARNSAAAVKLLLGA